MFCGKYKVAQGNGVDDIPYRWRVMAETNADKSRRQIPKIFLEAFEVPKVFRDAFGNRSGGKV